MTTAWSDNRSKTSYEEHDNHTGNYAPYNSVSKKNKGNVVSNVITHPVISNVSNCSCSDDEEMTYDELLSMNQTLAKELSATKSGDKKIQVGEQVFAKGER